MPCESFTDPSTGVTVIACSRGRGADRAARQCRWCSARSTKLCDGRPPRPPGHTRGPRSCDAPMCDAHAHNIGPNRDLCPDCMRRAEGAL